MSSRMDGVGQANSEPGIGSCLLLRYASQNSLDESSQKHIPYSSTKEKPPYRNHHHTHRAFDVMNVMRKQNLLCDVTLVADSVEVHAHKMVLAACSPYFYAMFTSFEESKQERITLQSIDPQALQLLVDYVYSSEVHVTEENVQVLLPAANLLQLTDVRDACCDFLQAQLHPTNCLGIRAFADLHGCLELLSHAETYIEQHFTEVVECEEFLTLSSQQVSKLISSDRLTVPSEEKVFECVIGWVHHDLEARQQHLAELMEHVRLPLLSQEYLVQRVEEEPLLKANLQCTIVKSRTDLKSVHKNLKRAQSTSTDNKAETNSIGDGPSIPSELKDVDRRLLGMNTESSASAPNSEVDYAENKESADNVRRPSGTSSPPDTLDNMANGDFYVENNDDDYYYNDSDSYRQDYREPPLLTQTRPNDVKHLSRKTAVGLKKRKLTATESITYAAEVQRDALQMDMAVKREAHEMFLQLKKEKLDLLQMKEEIAKEKLRFWKRKNGKDYLIEALKYHLLKGEQKILFKTPRTKPRQPVGLPKVLLVVGGQAPKAIRSVECYDFKEERWYQVAEMPTRRCRAGLCMIGGRVYAVGGFNGSLRVRTVDVYDAALDQWSSCASMEARRSTLGVAVLGNCIYAVGGFDGSTGLNSAEMYDPRSHEWRMIAPMSTRRSSVGVGVVNGLLYAVGGYDGASRQCLSSVECYSPETDSWSSVAEMSARRSGAGVGVLDGILYAVGGHDGPLVRKSVEAYNPETKTWSPVADMAFCRRNAGVVALNSLLYVVGGDDGSSNLASVEVYNPKTDSWSVLPSSMGIGRSYAGVAIIDKPM